MKLTKLWAEAQKKINAENWSAALPLLLKAQKLDDKHSGTLYHLSVVYVMLGQKTQALPLMAQLETLVWNTNAGVLDQMTAVYMKCYEWAPALRVALRSLELDASKVGVYMNLAKIYNHYGEHKKTFDMAMKALELDYSFSPSHMNAGSALVSMGLYKEAQISFETCLILDPKNLDARLNMSVAYSLAGDTTQAIEHFKKYLVLAEAAGHEKINVGRYSCGLALLKAGQIKEGWDMYEYGFDPEIPGHAKRSHARSFSVPRWEGQPIVGQRLLVWAEQGLGDEIMFLSCMRDILAVCSDVILECEPRLVAVMARSFPSVSVRAAAFDRKNSNLSVFNDFDHHIPLGSLPKLYRSTLQAFEHSVPYVIADAEKQDRFSRRLAGFEGKLKVGICWRSGLLTANRNKHYTAISDWGDILQLPNCVFVNLQYGDCEAELAEVEARYGLTILRWQDLDLKNDIDDALALMACLDLVVTAGTAVNPMAGSLGKATLLIQGEWGWPNLGTDHYPWFPNTHCFTPSHGQIAATLIPQVAAVMAEISP